MRSIVSFAIFVAVLGPLAGRPSAQSLSAVIPFDFRVGDAQMSAGAYRIYNLGARTGIEICRDGGHCIGTPSRSSAESDLAPTARLVFRKCDGTFVLTRIASPSAQSFEIPDPNHGADIRAETEILVAAALR